MNDDAATLALLEEGGDERAVLLRSGTVVTMDPALGQFTGDVLISGMRIADVGVDLGGAADGAVVAGATGPASTLHLAAMYWAERHRGPGSWPVTRGGLS